MIGNNVYGGGSGGSTKQLGIYPIGTNGKPTGDVIVPDGVGILYANAIGLNSNPNITSISLPESINLQNEYVLSGNSNLKTIIFRGNPTFTNIGNYCFRGCTSLTSISIPNSVKTLGGACFHSCNSLTTIVIPDGVTSLLYACFHSSNSLTTITIPNSVVSSYFNVSNSDNVFYGCISLKTVNLSGGWNKSIFISNNTANFTNVLTHDSMLSIFNNLADMTGQTPLTITLGTTNLAGIVS